VLEHRLTRAEFEAGVNLPTGQRHRIFLVPEVGRVSFRGMFFETNKNFLMPSAFAHLSEIKNAYKDFAESKLLIVGHTDTVGDTSFNDDLSVELLRIEAGQAAPDE